VLRLLIGYFIAGVLFFNFIPIANAATITLLTGEKISGDIIEKTELHVIISVNGVPTTYYNGEIADIDGQAIGMPQDQAINSDVARAEKSPAPYYGDEQDSLVNFMQKRSQATAPAAPVVTTPTTAPVAPAAPAPTAPDQSVPVSTTTPDKAVVTTSDGGIIVVQNDKITKYDKDFKVVKEVDLNPDNTAASSTPPAAPLAPPAPVAPTAAAPAASPAPASAPAAAPAPVAAPADQSAASTDLPTLKDFFSSFFSSTKK